MKKERMIDIDTAYNGFEGYDKAIYNDYNLIICDINMPVMDGYQFCINFLKISTTKINYLSSQNKYKRIGNLNHIWLPVLDLSIKK